MTWVFIGLVVVVVAAVAAVAVGHGAGLTVAQPDRPEVALPAGRLLGAADLETVEFSVGLRGYRMDEVDDLLSRLAAELAQRDERLRLLTPAPTPTPTPALPPAAAPTAPAPAVTVVPLGMEAALRPAGAADPPGDLRSADDPATTAADTDGYTDANTDPATDGHSEQDTEQAGARDWADRR